MGNHTNTIKRHNSQHLSQIDCFESNSFYIFSTYFTAFKLLFYSLLKKNVLHLSHQNLAIIKLHMWVINETKIVN